MLIFGSMLSGKSWMNVHDNFVLVFLMFFIFLCLIQKEKENLRGLGFQGKNAAVSVE